MDELKNKEKFYHRSHCPICSSEDKIILLSRDFTHPSIWEFLDNYYHGKIKIDDLLGVNFEIFECKNCSFIWQANILNDAFMDKLYGEWIDSRESFLKKKHANKELFIRYANEVKKIVSFFKKKPFEIKVFDFGMGWGYWCQMAKAFGCDVMGLEASQERIDFARKNGIRIISNLEEMPKNTLDFINIEHVFEHITNPLEVLKELQELLNDGGIIKISVPNGWKIKRNIMKDNWHATKDALHPLEHINCFTNKTLIKLAHAVGLQLMWQPLFFARPINFKSIVKLIFSRWIGTTLYFKK
jgi:2-polyprenyl-3-methyl-5-hydroxy-6-metoxy-1,4-benzoquinol methylase